MNLLNLAIPFPTPLDTAQTLAQILSAISPFLATVCDPPPIPLTLAVAGPAKNTILTTNQTTVPLDASLSTSASGHLTYLWQQDLGSLPLQIVNDTSMVTSAILQGGPGNYESPSRSPTLWVAPTQDTLRIIYREVVS